MGVGVGWGGQGKTEASKARSPPRQTSPIVQVEVTRLKIESQERKMFDLFCLGRGREMVCTWPITGGFLCHCDRGVDSGMNGGGRKPAGEGAGIQWRY